MMRNGISHHSAQITSKPSLFGIVLKTREGFGEIQHDKLKDILGIGCLQVSVTAVTENQIAVFRVELLPGDRVIGIAKLRKQRWLGGL